MKRMRLRLHLLLPLFLLSIGCAGLTGRTLPERPASAPLHFFQDLDSAVEDAGVRDSAFFGVPNYPYLRTDRFLAQAQEKIADLAQKKTWLRRMQALDLSARAKEIRNLPIAAQQRLTQKYGPDLIGTAARYSEKMLAEDMIKGLQDIRLYEAVAAPSEYSTAMRAAGLYPLASVPVIYRTHRAYQKLQRWHDTPIDALPARGEIIAFRPQPARPDSSEFSAEEKIRSMMAFNRDPLGMWEFPEGERYWMAAVFAPVLFQDISGMEDWPGEIIWNEGTVTVNPEAPTLYYYFTHSRMNEETVLQINYSIWYRARTAPAPWIERGDLDGMTVRISLTPDGRPFMVDVMNNSGYYHFFAPNEAFVEDVISHPLEIDSLVPTKMPAFYPNGRLGLRISSGWHQVQGLFAADLPRRTISYRLVPYDILESLPKGKNFHESIFTPEGIAKDSARIEPFLLFSMGIPKAGYMRQRNHHPLKLVGKAHFTHPDIFNKNFLFKR